MKTYLVKAILFVSVCMCFDMAHAWRDVPSCYKDLEINFFDPEITTQAFALHNIDQSSWNLLLQSLKNKAANVPSIIDQRAKRMQRNPLDHPFQPKEAEQLLMDVLYENLVEALHERNFITQFDNREMFNYIRRRQADRLKACFGEYKGRKEY